MVFLDILRKLIFQFHTFLHKYLFSKGVSDTFYLLYTMSIPQWQNYICPFFFIWDIGQQLFIQINYLKFSFFESFKRHWRKYYLCPIMLISFFDSDLINMPFEMSINISKRIPLKRVIKIFPRIAAPFFQTTQIQLSEFWDSDPHKITKADFIIIDSNLFYTCKNSEVRFLILQILDFNKPLIITLRDMQQLQIEQVFRLLIQLLWFWEYPTLFLNFIDNIINFHEDDVLIYSIDLLIINYKNEQRLSINQLYLLLISWYFLDINSYQKYAYLLLNQTQQKKLLTTKIWSIQNHRLINILSVLLFMKFIFIFCWLLLSSITVSQNQLQKYIQSITNSLVKEANSFQKSINDYLNNGNIPSDTDCKIYNDNYGFLNNCTTQFPPYPSCQSDCKDFNSFTYKNHKEAAVSEYPLYHNNGITSSVLSFYLNSFNQKNLINLKYSNPNIAITSITFYNDIFVHYPARRFDPSYSAIKRGWFIQNICPFSKKIYFLINDDTYNSLVQHFLNTTRTKMNQFYNQTVAQIFQTYKIVYIDDNNNVIITNLQINPTSLNYNISNKYSNVSQMVQAISTTNKNNTLELDPKKLNILILITNLKNTVNLYDVASINNSLNSFQNTALIVFNTGDRDPSNSNTINLMQITNDNRGCFISYAPSYSYPQSYAEIMMFIGSQAKPGSPPVWSYPYINIGTVDQWYIDISLPIKVNISSKSNTSLPYRSICIAIYTVEINISKLLTPGNNIQNEVSDYIKTIGIALNKNVSYHITDYLNPDQYTIPKCQIVSPDGKLDNCCSTPDQICSKNVGGLIGILLAIILTIIGLAFLIKFLLYKYILTKQNFIKGKFQEVRSEIIRRKAFDFRRKKILEKLNILSQEFDKLLRIQIQQYPQTSGQIIKQSSSFQKIPEIQTLISHMMYASTENNSSDEIENQVSIIRKCYPLLKIYPERDTFDKLKEIYKIQQSQSNNPDWRFLILKKQEYQDRIALVNDLLAFIKQIKIQRSSFTEVQSPRRPTDFREMNLSNRKQNKFRSDINKCCRQLEQLLEKIKFFNIGSEDQISNYETNSEKLRNLLIEETVTSLLQPNLFENKQFHFMELRKQNRFSLIILSSKYDLIHESLIVKSIREFDQLEAKIIDLIRKYKYIEEKLLSLLNEQIDLKGHKLHIQNLTKEIFAYAIEEFTNVFSDKFIKWNIDNFNKFKQNIWNLLKVSNSVNLQKKNHLKYFYAPLKINLLDSFQQIKEKFDENEKNSEEIILANQYEYVQIQ